MTYQAIWGEQLTLTKVTNKILKVYDQATEEEKFDWYKDANAFAKSIAKSSDHKDVAIACGVIAALSPMNLWSNNKRMAKEAMESGVATGSTTVLRKKANDILVCSGSEDEILRILNGNKICSFFKNMLYPAINSDVTIDRHAISVALGRNIGNRDEYKSLTAKQYQFFADAYKRAAKKRNATALMMQSVTWVAHKRLKKTS